MVGVNISQSYFHPGGAHITWVKIISHTGTDDPSLTGAWLIIKVSGHQYRWLAWWL